MNIDHIKTMIRVGEIKAVANERKLTFEIDKSITREQLRDIRGRVYAIVVDGVIEKIGGSQDAGGIRGTIGWYLNGFNKGNSQRTYCTWNFFTRAIAAKKKVEVYAVWAPLVTVTIPTMTGSIEKEMPVDYHTIEKAFNDEYFELEGKHPTLNMQESGQRWQDTGLLEGFINTDGSITTLNNT